MNVPFFVLCGEESDSLLHCQRYSSQPEEDCTWQNACFYHYFQLFIYIGLLLYIYMMIGYLCLRIFASNSYSGIDDICFWTIKMLNAFFGIYIENFEISKAKDHLVLGVASKHVGQAWSKCWSNLVKPWEELCPVKLTPRKKVGTFAFYLGASCN